MVIDRGHVSRRSLTTGDELRQLTGSQRVTLLDRDGFPVVAADAYATMAFLTRW